MITLEEFDIVQKLLGKDGRPRMTKQEHAYTGEIHCGECGCLHTGATKTKTILSTGEQKSYTYYYCTRRKKDITCTQTKPLTAQELELQIDKELAKSQINPKFLQWALDYLNERNELEVADRSKVYESQQATYNKTQNELDNLSKMYYKELINEDEFTRMRDDLRSQLAKLKIALQETEMRATKWLDKTQEFFHFTTYARAIANKPEIIFADEPTGNLDTENSNRIMELLKSLQKDRGFTIMMVTHNSEIGAMGDIQLKMKDGLLV
jgi:hypothetical protein